MFNRPPAHGNPDSPSAEHSEPERRHRTVRRKCVARKRRCRTKSGASGFLERRDDHQVEGPTADVYIVSEPADLVGHSLGELQKCSVSAAGFEHRPRRSALKQLRSLPVQGSRAEIHRAWQILPKKQREHTLKSSKSESEPLLDANPGSVLNGNQQSAIIASVRKPPGTTCLGAGAWNTPSLHARHAILGRDVTMARYWTGMTSSRSICRCLCSAAHLRSRTFLLVREDHFLDAGQVRGQRRPCCPAFPSLPFFSLACCLLAKRLRFSTSDVEIIEGKRQLISSQLFRQFTEYGAGDLVDDMLHPSFTIEASQDHGLESGDIVRKVGCRGGHAPLLAISGSSAMTFRSRESGVQPIVSSPEPGYAAYAFSTNAALRTRQTPAMPTAASRHRAPVASEGLRSASLCSQAPGRCRPTPAA